MIFRTLSDKEVKAVLILFAVLTGFALSRLGLPASFLTWPLLVAAMFAVTMNPYPDEYPRYK